MATKESEDLGELLLRLLADRDGLDSYELSQELGKDHQLLIGAIKSLHTLPDVSWLSDT